MTYIGCYFDMDNVTDPALWTNPVAAADKCTDVRRPPSKYNFRILNM